MGDDGYLGCFSHVHGEVFKFGQTAVCVGLGLEDVASPETYDGEAVGFVPAATVYVERQFGLYSGECGLCPHHFLGEFAYVASPVGKHGGVSCAEEFLGAGGMVVGLPVFQFLVTI